MTHGITKANDIRQGKMADRATAQASPVGDLIYVDSTNGNDGHDGLSKTTAVQTLTQAVSNANAGDTIVLRPGGSETVTAAIAIALASLKIVCKVDNPANGFTISGAGTLDLLSVTAADVHIEGLILAHTGATANASGILGSAAANGLSVKNCLFDDTAIVTTKTGVGVEATAGLDDLDVDGCVFLDNLYGVQIVASSTNVSDRPVIRNCEFFIGLSAGFGVFAAAGTGAVQGIRVLDCLFHEADGDGSAATTAWDGTDGTDATQGPISFGAAVDQYLIKGCYAQTSLTVIFRLTNAVNSGANGEFVDSRTQAAGDLTSVYSDTAAIHSETTAIQALAVTIASDCAVIEGGSLTTIGSDTTAIESELIQVHSETTALQAQATTIASDAARIHSDATHIHSDSLAIHSDTAVIASDLVHIGSDCAHIDSDVTDIQSDTTRIHSDTAAIHSTIDLVHSETTALQAESTTIYSDTAAIHSTIDLVHSETTAIQSDTTAIHSTIDLVHSETTAIQSDTTHINSDCVAIESELIQVHSETTALQAESTTIYSDTAAIHSTIDLVHSETTALQAQATTIASDLLLVYSDTATIASDLLLVHSEVTEIQTDVNTVASDLLLVHSETTAIQSDTTHINSDCVAIESELISVHSETTQLQSDTAAIHSDTAIIASDIVLVYSDTAAIHSTIDLVHSETTAIQSDTTELHAWKVVTVLKSNLALDGGPDEDVFAVNNGPVEILGLIMFLTEAVSAHACAVSWNSDPTTGAGDAPMCAALDINGFQIGDQLFIDGTGGNAMIRAANGTIVGRMCDIPQVVFPGGIDFEAANSNPTSGIADVYLTYRPLTATATVTVV